MVFARPVRLWLLPGVVLLAVMGAWGAIRYPHLPDRPVPAAQHARRRLVPRGLRSPVALHT